ncbi:hypothetical protein FEDK69T_21330 [Flavobacterium enshiense DK69]|nr:hypothetical protein FEDK69T_21330 [Flavobacterium enshiense DK69]
MGLDIETIKTTLESGFGHTVEIVDFAKIAGDYSVLPYNAVLFYTASYNENYNQFIKDVVFDISQSRPDVLLLPNIDQLYSFENKGYQELYKKRIGIKNVPGSYFGDTDDFLATDVSYPFVYKSLRGAMSSGVQLINTGEEFHRIVRKGKKIGLVERLRLLKKERKKHKDQSLQPVEKYSDVNFSKFFTKRNPFVVQQFVPGLECDYKVLQFGEKYFVLKRSVRDNDFKASGSGKFEWVEPSEKVLDYAESVIVKMNVPFNSLDIVETADYCALVEFQGIGFGPLTLIGSSFYYQKFNGNWQKIMAKSNLETEYANAIHCGLNKF